MTVDVLNINGEKTGTSVDLTDRCFWYTEPNEHVLYLAVKAILGKPTSGHSHKAKERGEITGSTRKIKRQKGTGTARAGDPLRIRCSEAGGRAFGPRPRDYDFKLNKKCQSWQEDVLLCLPKLQKEH